MKIIILGVIIATIFVFAAFCCINISSRCSRAEEAEERAHQYKLNKTEGGAVNE